VLICCCSWSKGIIEHEKREREKKALLEKAEKA
jgi:hypothetical protein